MYTKVKEDLHWVGVVDWNVRDFHDYETLRGSTYNAYLICDEKTALVDTVKAPFAGKLMENLSELADPASLDYVIANHAELDHSGALAAVMAQCPQATIVATEKTRDLLGMYGDISGWSFQIVGTGDTLSLGKRTLSFLETPMAHWPDSSVTYVAEDRLLLSNDAFGQHYASSGRFDDEVPLDVLMAEARTYYANILMPYGKQVARALEAAAQLDIETIAPSHGVIWRTHPGEIVSAYADWAAYRPAAKVLVIYDSMWQSTDAMAQAILEGATRPGVAAKLLNIRATSRTVIATEALDAAAIAFGSPTLNKTLMPEMAAVLTYLKGLGPAGKAGFAFGSYGWAPGGPKDVEGYLQDMKFEVLREPLTAQYRPTPEVLTECRAAGELLADRAEELATAAERG
jgi:flavorubredoxin